VCLFFFHPLGDFLNPALALLGQGLKKSPIGQKLDFANHSYLCKGLYIFLAFLLFTVSTNGLELKKINTLDTGSYISILLIGT
jgi:hypothetical protein